jgi:hypothetical protein
MEGTGDDGTQDHPRAAEPSRLVDLIDEDIYSTPAARAASRGLDGNGTVLSANAACEATLPR